jgi:type VI secretion system protein ImpG
MFNRYYQDELLYLRELGTEFARAHPAAAHFLSTPGSDPDVERLLEGFAFIAGRIRQKLDDELPEVTHALMGLLWPHYLRPVPSMSILEFQPVLPALRQSQRVPRGVEVQSVPVEGTACRFRTAYDVVLNPISLDQVQLEVTAAGPSRMRLGFRIWNQVKPEVLDLNRVRLYLHGDPALALALYYHLRTHVVDAVATASNPDGRSGGEASRPIRILASGFEEDGALLPYPIRSLPGYRLLQEYFSLPEKFLFLDLEGLQALPELAVGDHFWVEIRFDRALPATLRPTKEEVRLFCTPIVNLFPHEADPIRVDRTKAEYRVRPAGQNSLHYEVHSIDRVAGSLPGTATEREIPPFYSFAHRPVGSDGFAYYLPRSRNSVVDGRSDTYLSFMDARGGAAIPSVEIIGIDLTCTNRRLPEGLRAGDIQIPTDSSPEFVRFRNLTVPTLSASPPLDGDLHWRLISHMSLSYLSLTKLEALRGILGLYNIQASRDSRAFRANALRLEGIDAIRAAPKEILVRGCPVRGTAVEIDLREDCFAGDGDLYLFASVLSEFMSLHASLNSFVQLTVRGIQRGEVHIWPCKTGRQQLL